jgi:hypothetical protein
MEILMHRLLSRIVTFVFLSGNVTAAAAELPALDAYGFPITPYQLTAAEPPNAEQCLPPFTVMVAGKPASPHRIAVFASRRWRRMQQVSSEQ